MLDSWEETFYVFRVFLKSLSSIDSSTRAALMYIRHRHQHQHPLRSFSCRRCVCLDPVRQITESRAAISMAAHSVITIGVIHSNMTMSKQARIIWSVKSGRPARSQSNSMKFSTLLNLTSWLLRLVVSIWRFWVNIGWNWRAGVN